MKADTGPIGGDLSHEFQDPGPTPGSRRYSSTRRWLAADWAGREVDYSQDLTPLVEELNRPVMLPQRKSTIPPWKRPGRSAVGAARVSKSAISSISAPNTRSPWGAVVPGPNGESITVEKGVIWHRRIAPGGRSHRSQPRRCRYHLAGGVAPFRVGLINLKTGDARCDEACEKIYRALSPRCAVRRPRRSAGVEIPPIWT